MPVLNINEDEKNAVIAALHHERVRLTGEWSKAFDDEEGSVIYRDSELERIAAAIDLTTDLRRKIEVADDADTAAKADRIDGELQDIGEAVEAAGKALGDIKVKIDLNVGGKTTTLEGYSEGMARLLRDMDLAQRSY
jgi:hypothetical protein